MRYLNRLKQFSFLSILIFFFGWQLISLKAPVPADSLIGLYHPWRDNAYLGYAISKIPVKNPIITDPVLQTFPWRKLVIKNIKQVDPPLWNPYSFSGQPLLANVQSATFSVFNVLFLLFPFNIAWISQIILAQVLLSIFMFMFLKSLNLSSTSSTFGAFVLPFSGFFISWMTWGTVIPTVIWLPLILYLVNKFRNKIEPTKFTLLIFAVFQTLVGGHLQTAFYVSCVSLAYTVYVLANAEKYKKFLLVVLAFFLSFLIAQVQLLPTFEFISLSNRENDQTFYQDRQDWFMPPENLLQIIAPDFFGNPATSNYWGVWNYLEFVTFMGIIPLSLALLGIFKNRNKFFLVTSVVALLFALENPISKIPFIFQIPFISAAQPSRINLVLTFILVIMAAFGLEYFLKNSKKKFLLVSPIIISAIVVILILSTLLLKDIFPTFQNLDTAKISFRNLAIPLFFSTASLLVMILSIIGVKQKILIILIFSLTAAEVFRFAYKLTPFTNLNLIFPKTKTTDFLTSQEKPFRIMSTDRRILHPNSQTYFNIESVSGYDPLYLTSYAKFVSLWDSGNSSTDASFNRIVTPTNVDSNLTDLLNVKYIITFDEINSEKTIKVFEEGITKIYENKNAIPRAFFTTEIVKVNSPEEELESLKGNIDFSKTNYSNQISFQSKDSSNSNVVEIQDYTDQSFRLKTKTSGDAPLILSNIYYPGWRAYLDDNPIQIYEANYLMQALIVPSGEHSIYVKYLPNSFLLGSALSLFGILLTIPATIWIRKRQ